MAEETVYISIGNEKGRLIIDGNLALLGRFLSTVRDGSKDERPDTARAETQTAEQREGDTNDKR